MPKPEKSTVLKNSIFFSLIGLTIEEQSSLYTFKNQSEILQRIVPPRLEYCFKQQLFSFPL